jgi:hypothetical protein
VAMNFNGVQELFRRADNAQCLIDVLKDGDLLTLSWATVPIEQTVTSIMQNSFVEVLLSHESVLANANAEQQREIAAIAVKNMLIKERQPQLYSWYNLESSACLLGTTLKMGNSRISLSPDLEAFLQTGTSQNVTQLIEELLNNYVKF